MKTLFLVVVFSVLACGVALAETVFHEDFSVADTHFSGFQTGPCPWHTPGANPPLVAYFGDGQYAEMSRMGCLRPFFVATIVSDSIDLTGYSNVVLSFDHYYYRWYLFAVGWVEVSVNGGKWWTIVYVTIDKVPGIVEQISLPEADGEADLRIRFSMLWMGGFGLPGYWGIDDVTVTGMPFDADE